MDTSRRVPQLVGRKGDIVNGNINQDDRSKDSALPPRKTLPEGEQGGSVTDFQEPRKPPDDVDGDHLPLRAPRDGDDDIHHDQIVSSLDMDNQSSFQVDDDRNSPQDLLSYRRDRAGHGSLSGDDGSGLFSPQPFAAPEEELDVDGGMYEQQPLSPQSHGDRCRTRGKQQERIVRGTGLGRVKPRANSQVGLMCQRAERTIKHVLHNGLLICTAGWRLYYRTSGKRRSSR